MDIQYFVKFIGDKHVTVAKAYNENEAKVLRTNQYEKTTPQFYEWVRSKTNLIEANHRH
ncbi:MAG: hypothetical protein L0154_20945 [Chloroflexi bacterium]|nr:hypothetical protein [Chloroflexota bacterium]